MARKRARYNRQYTPYRYILLSLRVRSVDISPYKPLRDREYTVAGSPLACSITTQSTLYLLGVLGRSGINQPCPRGRRRRGAMKNWKAIGSSRFAVVGALLLVGMLWGSSFPLVAVAAPTLGAVGTTHGRFIVAALVLALITASSRSTWRAVGHRFPAFLLLAALNVAGPLTLVATAIVGLNSSTASILNATTPMFTVFVAAFWLRQKITWRKLSGVAIGIVGVSVLVGGIPSAIDSRAMLAIGASLTAALLTQSEVSTHESRSRTLHP